jgi:hypothetical protein
MDAESSLQPGGTLEPAGRTAFAKMAFQKLDAPVTVRYELRDPFEEVTYRLKTFEEMVLQADRLGATRFQAVDSDGTRVPVEKIDGEWKRSDARESHPGIEAKHVDQTSANAYRNAPVPVEPQGTAGRTEADAAIAERSERLERELRQRYVVKRAAMEVGGIMMGQIEYRFRGDTARIAFTESTFKLATDSNSPSVARSMIDVSEARGWRALRISGHEDFRRLVWLEASVRGIKAVGYEPSQADRELLLKERDARHINRIEPAHVERVVDESVAAAMQTGRGSGGKKAVLAALEAVLVANHVPVRQRDAVMSAAADNLAARLRNGETHKIKVFDKSAPVQRPAVQPAREVQRTRDRAAPAR